MSELPKNPTKQEEIDHLTAFVEALPKGCYLSSLLDGIVECCESLIADDLMFSVVRPADLLEREYRSVQELERDARLRLGLLEKEEHDSEYRLGALRRSIEEARDQARGLARKLMDV